MTFDMRGGDDGRDAWHVGAAPEHIILKSKTSTHYPWIIHRYPQISHSCFFFHMWNVDYGNWRIDWTHLYSFSVRVFFVLFLRFYTSKVESLIWGKSRPRQRRKPHGRFFSDFRGERREGAYFCLLVDVVFNALTLFYPCFDSDTRSLC